MNTPIKANNLNLHQIQEPATLPLRTCVQQAVERYFSHLDGQPVDNLYQMVLAEVEEPLFLTVMDFTHGNQSEAARLLGINRGTLRKKLEQYDLLQRVDS